MPKHSYFELYYHITWHTKVNQAVITPDAETKLYSYLKHKVLETPESICHALGGTEDHIHLAVTLPPTVLISEWIGRMKGASSHEINRIFGRKYLEWQRGYGVVSFGQRDLPWVVSYVLNQKEHHRNGTTYERLERTDYDDG